MSARFWWRVRRIWHAPNHWRQAAGPMNPRELYWGADYVFRHGGVRKGLWCALWLTPRDLLKWLWWQRWTLLWWQPLRCNGNHGGWRTQLCEWLEAKARHEERRERVMKRRRAGRSKKGIDTPLYF